MFSIILYNTIQFIFVDGCDSIKGKSQFYIILPIDLIVMLNKVKRVLQNI